MSAVREWHCIQVDHIAVRKLSCGMLAGDVGEQISHAHLLPNHCQNSGPTSGFSLNNDQRHALPFSSLLTKTTVSQSQDSGL